MLPTSSSSKYDSRKGNEKLIEDDLQSIDSDSEEDRAPKRSRAGTAESGGGLFSGRYDSDFSSKKTLKQNTSLGDSEDNEEEPDFMKHFNKLPKDTGKQYLQANNANSKATTSTTTSAELVDNVTMDKIYAELPDDLRQLLDGQMDNLKNSVNEVSKENKDLVQKNQKYAYEKSSNKQAGLRIRSKIEAQKNHFAEQFINGCTAHASIMSKGRAMAVVPDDLRFFEDKNHLHAEGYYKPKTTVVCACCNEKSAIKFCVHCGGFRGLCKKCFLEDASILFKGDNNVQCIFCNRDSLKKAAQQQLKTVKSQIFPEDSIVRIMSQQQWLLQMMVASPQDKLLAYKDIKRPQVHLDKSKSLDPETSRHLVKLANMESKNAEAEEIKEVSMQNLKKKNTKHYKWKNLCLQKNGGSIAVVRQHLAQLLILILNITGVGSVVHAMVNMLIFWADEVTNISSYDTSGMIGSANKYAGSIFYNMCKQLSKDLKHASSVNLDNRIIWNTFFKDSFLVATIRSLDNAFSTSTQKALDASNQALSTARNNNRTGGNGGNGGVDRRQGPGSGKTKGGDDTRTGGGDANKGGEEAKKKREIEDKLTDTVKHKIDSVIDQKDQELAAEAAAAIFSLPDKEYSMTQKKISLNKYFTNQGLCRNCFYHGLGRQSHDLKSCQQPCMIECSTCATAGFPGLKHWREDCQIAAEAPNAATKGAKKGGGKNKGSGKHK